MNGTVGQTAVLLGFVGAVSTIGVLGYGLFKRRPSIIRHGRSYHNGVWGGMPLALAMGM